MESRSLRSGQGLLNVLAVVLLCVPLAAQAPKEVTEPKLLSLFPAGGTPGQTVKAEIRGLILSGATAAWFESGELRATVQHVEELTEKFPETLPGAPPPRIKPQPVYRATIEVEIPSGTHPGIFPLRLVTPLGLSTSLPFQVLAEPLIAEATAAHSAAKEAQEIEPPTSIFARLERRGETDFYKIRTARGELLTFEVSASQDFVPRLAIYRQGGSWFDAERPSRVLFEEERNSDLMFATPRATFRAPEDGNYFFEVSSLFGKGGPDCTYRLRVTRGASLPIEVASSEWKERTFKRTLEEAWITTLVARGVAGSGSAPAYSAARAQGAGAAPADPGETPSEPALATQPQIVREDERAGATALPAIFEGAVEGPGDVDSFRFKAEQGQRVTFEIETPSTTRPHFNPRIGVVDSADHEYFSNADRRVSLFNNNADPHVFLKALSPRSTFTFERGGEYVLNVRDITSRYGDPNFRYRILLRQQVPHVGEIVVENADPINLRPGEARKLAITAQFEEGFMGDVSFSLEGLPPGVQALPAAQFSDGRAPLEIAQNPDTVLPKDQKAALVLVAAPDAPLTREPVLATLLCRPMAGGKLGSSLRVRTLPIMIVAGGPKAGGGK